MVRLDDERVWYRYHHLFAEVLRQRLSSSVPGATVAALHTRASVWYEQQGQIVSAVEHGLSAADEGRAARLIEQHGLRMLVSGAMQTVLGWLSRLPEERILARPQLCGLHALALMFSNELEAAEARLQDSEHCISRATPAAQADLIRGNAAAIRANIAMYRGDLAGCVTYGQAVLHLLPETEHIARTMAQLHLTRAFRVSGDVTEAVERNVLAVVAPIRATQNMVGTIGAVTNLARLQVLQGRLRAAATYRELAGIVAGPDELRGLHGGLAYYVGMGDLYREWNDLGVAAVYLAQALQLLPGSLVVDAEDVALGYLTLARLQYTRGDHSAADVTLATFIDLARRRGFAGYLLARGRAVQAQLALAGG